MTISEITIDASKIFYEKYKISLIGSYNYIFGIGIRLDDKKYYKLLNRDDLLDQYDVCFVFIFMESENQTHFYHRGFINNKFILDIKFTLNNWSFILVNNPFDRIKKIYRILDPNYKIVKEYIIDEGVSKDQNETFKEITDIIFNDFIPYSGFKNGTEYLLTQRLDSLESKIDELNNKLDGVIKNSN